ncbi:MAG TPA: molybdopterin cofactor-binding domain-containing protein, partial [Ilumatobacteraceae bacterium]|nr:molybdopterin cofactor-binding domain-containing protein [Ilumatobacteraceae bacterium]
MPGSILGERVIRKEDPKFLTSGGKYLDDLNDVPELDRAAHVVYVRSAVAHGTITSIDSSEAAAMPGVLGVFTAGDLGLEPAPSPFNPTVARTILASDKVRYVGEPIVAVVAETRTQATDAAEAVVVDYDVLEAVVDPEEALTSSVHLYEAAGGNAVFDSTALGAPDLTGDEFFADCEVTATGKFINQRVAPCPLEVRGSAAAWIDGRLHQWVSTQHAQGIKNVYVASNKLEADQVRVRTPDVGGGFGAKIGTYPEEIALGELSKRLGRPVRWTETRSESMMALGHGRAQVQTVTIGGSRDGTVTHYRLHVIQDSGAF